MQSILKPQYIINSGKKKVPYSGKQAPKKAMYCKGSVVCRGRAWSWSVNELQGPGLPEYW